MASGHNKSHSIVLDGSQLSRPRVETARSGRCAHRAGAGWRTNMCPDRTTCTVQRKRRANPMSRRPKYGRGSCGSHAATPWAIGVGLSRPVGRWSCRRAVCVPARNSRLFRAPRGLRRRYAKATLRQTRSDSNSAPPLPRASLVPPVSRAETAPGKMLGEPCGARVPGRALRHRHAKPTLHQKRSSASPAPPVSWASLAPAVPRVSPAPRLRPPACGSRFPAQPCARESKGLGGHCVRARHFLGALCGAALSGQRPRSPA